MGKIKICGLRTLEDVEIMNEFLPDYVGFIFAESKRKIDLYTVKILCENLHPCIKKVGVFVNQERDFIENIQKQCGLDIIQLHGKESPDFCKSFETEVWKAISVSNVTDLKQEVFYDTSAVLLDTFDKNLAGGTGKSFDWSYLSTYSFKKPWILAGGISIQNIEKALSFQPFIIDVSSGVETNGKKDKVKVKEIIQKVREYRDQ